MTFFFACKSMWDSTVCYWSPSVVSFVAFLCVCTCGGHAASLPFFAKMAVGSDLMGSYHGHWLLFMFVTIAGSVSPLVATILCCESLLAIQFIASC